MKLLVKIILLFLLFNCNLLSQDVIKKDSIPFEIIFKEKYGMTLIDTAKIVVKYKNFFVITRNDGTTMWLPTNLYGLINIKEIK